MQLIELLLHLGQVLWLLACHCTGNLFSFDVVLDLFESHHFIEPSLVVVDNGHLIYRTQLLEESLDLLSIHLLLLEPSERQDVLLTVDVCVGLQTFSHNLIAEATPMQRKYEENKRYNSADDGLG